MNKSFFVLLILLVACAQPQAETPVSLRGNVESQQSASSNVVDVVIENFAFSPQIIEIKAGDSVRWTNKDSVIHTATGGGFDTGPIKFQESAEVRFDKPGTYTYKCMPHSNMNGKVVVE